MARTAKTTAVWLPGAGAAFDELRSRAQDQIASADRQGRDVRSARIRMRDDTGRVLFEGTLEEAAGHAGWAAPRSDATIH